LVSVVKSTENLSYESEIMHDYDDILLMTLIFYNSLVDFYFGDSPELKRVKNEIILTFA